jgi:hypothetical protein
MKDLLRGVATSKLSHFTDDTCLYRAWIRLASFQILLYSDSSSFYAFFEQVQARSCLQVQLRNYST